MMQSNNRLRIGGIFDIDCYRDGVLKWKTSAPNAVVSAGLDDILNRYFRQGIGTGPGTGSSLEGWAIGLIDGPAIILASSDTHTSHVGWSEFTRYSVEGDTSIRPEWLPAAAAGNVITSSLIVEFNITGAGHLAGIFLVGGELGVPPLVTDANRKNGVSSVPLLWSHAEFTTGSQRVTGGDVLRVIYRVIASNI